MPLLKLRLLLLSLTANRLDQTVYILPDKDTRGRGAELSSSDRARTVRAVSFKFLHPTDIDQ